jgi:hypothetical protein
MLILRASEAAYKKKQGSKHCYQSDQRGENNSSSTCADTYDVLPKLPSWPIKDVAAVSPLKLKILTKIPGSFVVKYSSWEPGA